MKLWQQTKQFHFTSQRYSRKIHLSVEAYRLLSPNSPTKLRKNPPRLVTNIVMKQQYDQN